MRESAQVEFLLGTLRYVLSKCWGFVTSLAYFIPQVYPTCHSAYISDRSRYQNNTRWKFALGQSGTNQNEYQRFPWKCLEWDKQMANRISIRVLHENVFIALES